MNQIQSPFRQGTSLFGRPMSKGPDASSQNAPPVPSYQKGQWGVNVRGFQGLPPGLNQQDFTSWLQTAAPSLRIGQDVQYQEGTAPNYTLVPGQGGRATVLSPQGSSLAQVNVPFHIQQYYNGPDANYQAGYQLATSMDPHSLQVALDTGSHMGHPLTQDVLSGMDAYAYETGLYNPPTDPNAGDGGGQPGTGTTPSPEAAAAGGAGADTAQFQNAIAGLTQQLQGQQDSQAKMMQLMLAMSNRNQDTGQESQGYPWMYGG